MKAVLFFTIVIFLIINYFIFNKDMTSVFSIKGKRSYMEDTYCIDNENNISIYGVFDGHGGTIISDTLKKIIPDFFRNKIFINDVDKTKIENAFIIIEKYLRSLVANNTVGSTACIVVKYNNNIYCINLGDSRLVLLKSKSNILTEDDIIIETDDHKPNKEKRRIEKENGNVLFDGYSYRVNGNLAMSRAFGDFYLKYNNSKFKGPVSIKPDVYIEKYNKNYKYTAIIGTDGLWDVMNNKNILDIYNHCVNKNIKNISAVIGATAYKKGSTDNITVVTTEI